MTDWRTARGAQMTIPEREWLRDVSAALAQKKPLLTIVHIGVEYGASLHCCKAGAPGARVAGVDLDISKFLGNRDEFLLIEGDSKAVGGEFHDGIDFLFIDGDHSRDGVHADIAEWIGKVKSPGVVAFHDYNTDLGMYPWTAGVREAVDGWHWADTTWQEIDAPDSIRAYGRKPNLRRGQPFGTIGIGVPYLKSVYKFWRWWSWLLVGGLQPGDQFLNDETVPGEVPIPMAHNALVMAFLRTDRDTLCIVEDDHVGQQDIIQRLRDKQENWKFDIVCANYADRRGGDALMGVWFADMPPNEYGEWTCQIRPMDIWEDGTQPVDVAALGLVLIRRWVLEAMQTTHNPNDMFWFDWIGRNSQDVIFYKRANEVGARVAVDRDNRIGHIGEKVHTVEEWYERRRKAVQKQGKQGKQED